MFWNKTARNSRRQQVLDELIDVPPEDRRIHLYRAVAEGDVRAREVEQALRLVSRLDSLRQMEIPTAFGPAKRQEGVTNIFPALAETAAGRPSSRARRRAVMEIALTNEMPASSGRRAMDPFARRGIEAVRRPGSDGEGSDGVVASEDQEPSIAWLRP